LEKDRKNEELEAKVKGLEKEGKKGKKESKYSSGEDYDEF
jgi:hypothetical protein